METKIQFIAGIDGGGTKTTVICQNLNGEILAEKRFGPFNINSIGEESFIALMSQICEFLNSIGECIVLYIGAAGVSNSQMQSLIELAMMKAGIEHWNLVGDHEIAFCGALEGTPGMSLIAGTGSICFGRNLKGEILRAGGWGHLLADEGSGYAIGRDALKAIVRYWDGCAEETSLVDAVAKELQIDSPQKMITYTYGNDKSGIARVAHIVEQEAMKGDKVANEILTENAKMLVELVVLVAKRLNIESGEIAMLGGLLENDTFLRKRLIETVEETCPEFVCVKPRQNAAMGAVMMAKNYYECNLRNIE